MKTREVHDTKRSIKDYEFFKEQPDNASAYSVFRNLRPPINKKKEEHENPKPGPRRHLANFKVRPQLLRAASYHHRQRHLHGWHYKSTNDTKMRFNNSQLK